MSEVKFTLDPSSVEETKAYLKNLEQSILKTVFDAMQEAMKGLAMTAVDEMGAAGIQRRTGDLAGAILTGINVKATSTQIRGTVASDVGRKHVGLWLEEGIHDPEVRKSRKAVWAPGHHLGEGLLYEFATDAGEEVWAHGHAAFNVRPHPFLNRALEEYETTITQDIQQAIDGAIAG